tara:strand:+ start:2471 stop:2836 length:366 start_codon:yes stop_codon:yes gene_type:complete
MATVITKHTYPQIYFLECEACKHFGIKQRTYKNWIDSGLTIPGRYKVKGSNYYVIKPEQFHTWLIETRLEVSTPQNKFHNRKVIKKITSVATSNNNNHNNHKHVLGGSISLVTPSAERPNK